MKKSKISLWVAAVVLFAVVGTTSARAESLALFQPAILGGVNVPTNSGASTGWGLGGEMGLTFGGFGVTADALYLAREFTGSSWSFLQIPVLVHFSLMPMFSVGVGGFYDVALSSGASSNGGLSAALRFKPTFLPAFVEGRYNYGLNTTNWPYHTSEFQLLLGILF